MIKSTLTGLSVIVGGVGIAYGIMYMLHFYTWFQWTFLVALILLVSYVIGENIKNRRKEIEDGYL